MEPRPVPVFGVWYVPNGCRKWKPGGLLLIAPRRSVVQERSMKIILGLELDLPVAESGFKSRGEIKLASITFCSRMSNSP